MSDTIVEKLFAAQSAESLLEAGLFEFDLVFEDLGWDAYDGSLEIKGVPSDMRLSVAMQSFIQGSGFHKVYVNHKDNWETHYTWGAEFAPDPGWRVSYPHKRGDGGKIWVEQNVPTWPKQWFETGYVLIVASPTPASPTMEE